MKHGTVERTLLSDENVDKEQKWTGLFVGSNQGREVPPLRTSSTTTTPLLRHYVKR